MKNFLVIANQNAVIFKDFFPFIKEGIVRPGYRPFNKDFYFDLSEETKEQIVKEKKEGSGWKIVDGEICGRLANACWYTTLPVQRDRKLVLTKSYDPELYPKYDHYDAINVNKVQDIPFDYDGVMGVPVTVVDYDLNDFKILHMLELKYRMVDGKYFYERVLIRRKQL